jgi:hypothetical protein
MGFARYEDVRKVALSSQIRGIVLKGQTLFNNAPAIIIRRLSNFYHKKRNIAAAYPFCSLLDTISEPSAGHEHAFPIHEISVPSASSSSLGIFGEPKGSCTQETAEPDTTHPTTVCRPPHGSEFAVGVPVFIR